MSSLFFNKKELMNNVKAEIEVSLNNNGFNSALSLASSLDKSFTGNLSDLIGDVVSDCNKLIDWFNNASELLDNIVLETENNATNLIISEMLHRNNKVK